MKRRITEAGLLGIGLWVFSVSVSAPHSLCAGYDATQPVTPNGGITKMEWTNPHSHFYLDVSDEKGNVTNWKFEGYNPAVLYRIGWKKDTTLKPGDKITVFGWQARDGGNSAHSRENTLPHGQKFF